MPTSLMPKSSGGFFSLGRTIFGGKLVGIDIDKERGVTCVTGFFSGTRSRTTTAPSPSPTPPNRASSFQFEANEGVWNGSDRAKQTKSLMRLSEEIKNQTGVGEPSQEENIVSIGETPHPAAHTWHGITHEKLW